MVAADRHQTVGQLHDKTRRTETDDLFRVTDGSCKFRPAQKAHLQLRFSGKKMQYKGR